MINAKFDIYLIELSHLKIPVTNSISSLKSNTQQSNAQNITTDRFLLKHIDIDTVETQQFHDSTLSLLDSMKTDTVKMYVPLYDSSSPLISTSYVFLLLIFQT